ncbi:Hsp20/alpha crystallin family protein [Bacillus sp. T33-2]|uniref:Hsp20/alpha crystallin family protein n=1 Tax=Bacillus sp. T33-2 TaxID=2054168 RepID=UPI000C7707CC|nr:Hsp20/alpha crystallin family protein [Bacillus sp. T33-2]PLR99705.1 heat-shock protein Hsp20 [Bacillus sp. T33-2]
MSSMNSGGQKKSEKAEQFGELIQTMSDFFHEKPVKGFLQTIDDFFKRPFPHSHFHVDVFETDRHHVITAELPGIKREHIDIDVFGNSLAISVNRSEISTEEDEKHNTFRRRAAFGRASRTITLSSPINEKKVKANYRDGLLEIRVPKLQGKKISIAEDEA